VRSPEIKVSSRIQREPQFAIFFPLSFPARATINRQAMYPASKAPSAICFTSFFDFSPRLNAIVGESNHDGVQEHRA
jgi:hypothetical protein